jgi:hypothetical protein
VDQDGTEAELNKPILSLNIGKNGKTIYYSKNSLRRLMANDSLMYEPSMQAVLDEY